jgi:hypothetical protein
MSSLDLHTHASYQVGLHQFFKRAASGNQTLAVLHSSCSQRPSPSFVLQAKIRGKTYTLTVAGKLASLHAVSSWAIFRLTDPRGVGIVTRCRLSGFHPHRESGIYTVSEKSTRVTSFAPVSPPPPFFSLGVNDPPWVFQDADVGPKGKHGHVHLRKGLGFQV